ncbi:PREDICTED: abhydrolase domain-containing protein 4-like [Priapulus caudatus]|nr:PREDICTED: abhydrolase domain-containing protein 4-like [Priapulus caudatus]
MKDKFKDLDEGALYDYIYHCNAQEPSGESAFRALTVCVGWAKNPMLQRIQEIDSRIPITMIYGSRSWVDSESGWAVKDLRKDSVVDVHVVKGSGHHVYSEQASEFNTLVRRACDFADSLARQEEEAGEALRLDGDDEASTRETLARSVSVLTMKDNPPRVGVVLD